VGKGWRVVCCSHTPVSRHAPTSPLCSATRAQNSGRAVARPTAQLARARVLGVGAKEWLRALPGLVVRGGVVTGEESSAVWRLDMVELRLERMSDLGCVRTEHACCAVRGNVVVLGGGNIEEGVLATVEVSRSDSEAGEHVLTALPPLSCGPRLCSVALSILESESAEGQVLLIGGHSGNGEELDEASRVVKVDLATGACSPHPPLLYDRVRFAAARLPDGRVVCAGGSRQVVANGIQSLSMTAEVLEPPVQGSADEVWRELPHMSVPHSRAAGCVLSDGRFAVFGGVSINNVSVVSCEALTLDGDERWEPLAPMLEGRSGFTCAAVGGCVIVAGGYGSTAVVEVYEEALGRWRQLPCNLPHGGGLFWTGSALLE
jgi:hypothetical protein